MNFIYGNEKNPDVNKFLCDYVGYNTFGRANDFGPCGTIGICQGQTIIAAVVFHNWHPEYGVIELSVAASSPAWFCRPAIREILGICFDQHQCQQTVARVDVENKKVIQILEFLKFKKVLLPNMRGKGKDEYLMMLTADEWWKNKIFRRKLNG